MYWRMNLNTLWVLWWWLMWAMLFSNLWTEVTHAASFEIYRVFLLFGNGFNSLSWLYFTFDFDDQTLYVAVRLCAVECGVYHNSAIILCRATSQCLKSVFSSKMIFRKLSENFRLLNFTCRPNYKLRDVSIKAKLHRDFENIEKERLPKVGTRRVPFITLFQQNLEKCGILYENNGFYVVLCSSAYSSPVQISLTFKIKHAVYQNYQGKGHWSKCDRSQLSPMSGSDGSRHSPVDDVIRVGKLQNQLIIGFIRSFFV